MTNPASFQQTCNRLPRYRQRLCNAGDVTTVPGPDSILWSVAWTCDTVIKSIWLLDLIISLHIAHTSCDNYFKGIDE